MSDTPEVSVVMSVYNGAAYLRESAESILSQEAVKLEFIVVDDGSTDESRAILEGYANRDERVRVIHQENQGLTRALIRGCEAAQGKYIARQDVGDMSLPGRLAKQLKCITQSANGAFVSCGGRFVGPEGEYLYDINQDQEDATDCLLTLDLEKVRGPFGSTTLFPSVLYRQVGGYRSAFYFAQDLDLWIRLAERGKHVIVPEILYQASVRVESISGLYRKEQIETSKIILECTRLRRGSLSEAPALERARVIRPSAKRRNSRLTRARALYFIGSCLNERRDPHARKYFRRAFQTFPLHLRSAARLLLR